MHAVHAGVPFVVGGILELRDVVEALAEVVLDVGEPAGAHDGKQLLVPEEKKPREGFTLVSGIQSFRGSEVERFRGSEFSEFSEFNSFRVLRV
jgi:hypothetical protein